MTTPPSDDSLPLDDFNFWFALKLAADAKDWPLISEYLHSSPTQQTPRHTLTIPVLEGAILAGKSAVVTELLARGYTPDHDTLKTITDKLEFVPDQEQEAVAAAFKLVVSAAPQADVRKLVSDAWRRNCATVVVPQLAGAGFDVLLGGDVIDLALAQDKPELMQLLFEQGISPFAPKLLHAMLGGPAPDADVRQVWWMATCAHRDARAALARFDHMKAAGHQWRAAAFINPIAYDQTGAEITLLGVLAAYGRVGEVFDARHWREARDEALALHERLGIYGVQDKVSLAPFVAALNRDAMQARTRAQRTGKFKL